MGLGLEEANLILRSPRRRVGCTDLCPSYTGFSCLLLHSARPQNLVAQNNNDLLFLLILWVAISAILMVSPGVSHVLSSDGSTVAVESEVASYVCVVGAGYQQGLSLHMAFHPQGG